MFTGARRGEALSAHWQEFDLSNKLWVVPSMHIKGGERHNIEIRRALPEYVVRDLMHWKQVCPSPNDLVFPSVTNPKKSRSDIAAIWNRIRERTGLHHIRVHDLRHNFATTALKLGASLEEIGDALGHRDRQTTLKYARFDHRNRQDVAKLVGDALSTISDQTEVTVRPPRSCGA